MTNSAIKKTDKGNKQIGLILIISLFFLWALTSNLLPTLIPHLKKACRLTNFQSSFLDTAYWLAYFIMAIPAAIVMNRTSYKTGIIIGLLIAATGALLFVPAASIREYWFFLMASFILASGMTFLETAANPYITVLGSAATAPQRLNFAQAFNGLGAFLSAMVLSKVILSGKEYSEAQLNSMPANELTAYLNSEANAVKLPYIGIALLLFLVAMLFVFVRFPSPDEEKVKGQKFNLNTAILKLPHLRWGVIAEFFYCGGQVCVSSFFIRYCQFQKVSETTATTYLGFLLLFFMVGRYAGAFLMKKIEAEKMLVIYGLCAVGLLLYAVLVGGKSSIYALFGVEFFMSIMFPTIFSLAIKGLGKDTKSASAFMVMSIIGGAIMPPVMGFAIDITNPQVAYLVPMICFLIIVFYGRSVKRMTQMDINTPVALQ
ncbi:MAG: L-fucose:H+ symporter permease [Ginsengibacter sp.]